MTPRLKTSLGIIALGLSIILFKSCKKTSSSSPSFFCSTCQSKPNALIQARFESSLGGVNFKTEVYHHYTQTKKTCEIGLANSVAREKFAKILSALEPLLGFQNGAGETTEAFTIFRTGELHTDSSVLLKDIVGVSRYYSKNNKLFHQLFVKNMNDGKFSELAELSAETDGVVFNYMHVIGLGVLNMPWPSTAFFLKTEDARGLYKSLKDAHDDLRWKIKIYIQKNRLQNSNKELLSESMENELMDNCGDPCTKNDGTICRNGDRLIDTLGYTIDTTGYTVDTTGYIIPTDGSANYQLPYYTSDASCGPNDAMDGHSQDCRVADVYNTIFRNSAVNRESLRLDNGITTSLENCINLPRLRDFRDNVLYKSLTGLKYINYYYLLSSRLKGKIDISTAFKTLVTAFDVNNAINILLDKTTKPNVILITPGFSAELVDMLNFYKNKTKDADALAAFNAIINDMNFLKGKSVLQVKELLSR